MNKTLSKVASVVEGLILIILGAYIFYLIASGKYPYYMNPKYIWISGTAAFFLLIISWFRLRYIDIIKVSRLVLFGFLLVLCLFVPVKGIGIDVSAITGSDSLPTRNWEIMGTAVSRENCNGTEYIRINIAELYQIINQKDSAKTGQNYVMRGFVLRDKLLDQDGSFGFSRVFYWCCAADAATLAIRVPYQDLEDLENHQAVMVYGKLKQTEKFTRHVGSLMTILIKEWVFIPDQVLKIQPPENHADSFIANVSTEEPYFY